MKSFYDCVPDEPLTFSSAKGFYLERPGKTIQEFLGTPNYIFVLKIA